MATREENLKKLNDELEKLDDEQLEQVAGGIGVFSLPPGASFGSLDSVRQRIKRQILRRQNSNDANEPKTGFIIKLETIHEESSSRITEFENVPFTFKINPNDIKPLPNRAEQNPEYKILPTDYWVIGVELAKRIKKAFRRVSEGFFVDGEKFFC